MHHNFYAKTKIIPRLMGERTEMFRYYSSKFRVSKNKKKAARAVMHNEFRINYSYTIETSYYGYIDQNRETIPFTTEKLFTLGEKLARSLLEFYSMVEKDRKKYLQRKSIRAKLQIKEQIETIFLNFEDFEFEIPELSYSSTTNIHKSPTDAFSTIYFNNEYHLKRELED